MTRRQAIETALAKWRASERKLAGANGDTNVVQAEVDSHRDEYRRLSTDDMIERLDDLKDAELRRASATPSTEPFHRAAQDEKVIANGIWESARQSDEDTPQTRPER